TIIRVMHVVIRASPRASRMSTATPPTEATTAPVGEQLPAMTPRPNPGPPIPDRNDALDGLRAVACLMVFVYHVGYAQLRPPLVFLGFTGVHVFFVLSGYLLFRPFLPGLLGERPLPDWRRYAIRRFLRIYPAYAVCLVVSSLARVAAHDKPPTVGNFVGHLLLVFNYTDRSNFFTIN